MNSPLMAAAKAALAKQQEEALLPATPVQERTFVHQVAGATTILPSGKVLSFYGKRGGFGYYSTDIPAELDWLIPLSKQHGTQITEAVVNPVTHIETIIEKAVDPAIHQAALDAAVNSQRVLDPTVAAAVEKLSAHIAAAPAEPKQ